jgi:hypothetical protein
MTRASSNKKGRKGRAAQAKPRRAPSRKARGAKNTALTAERDATRKQEVQRKRRENSELARVNNAVPLFASRELTELINRRTSAFLELPLRMACCRSPLALWSEQTRFVHGMFSDCHLLAQRMMTNAVNAWPMLRDTRAT